jgi:hypothetical protein
MAETTKVRRCRCCLISDIFHRREDVPTRVVGRIALSVPAYRRVIPPRHLTRIRAAVQRRAPGRSSGDGSVAVERHRAPLVLIRGFFSGARGERDNDRYLLVERVRAGLILFHPPLLRYRLLPRIRCDHGAGPSDNDRRPGYVRHFPRSP